MKQLPIIVAAIILIATGTCTSCANRSGQLTATEIAPLVQSVTDDLEAYVALGIAPSGTPITDGERLRVLGGVAILRNAVHTALKEPREPLPTLEGAAR